MRDLINVFRGTAVLALAAALSQQAFAQTGDLVNWASPLYWSQEASSSSPSAKGQKFAAVSGQLPLVAVTPCRLVDTRTAYASLGFAGPFGQPGLAGTNPAQRDIPVPLGQCGIPANAKAYSLNFTVVPKGPMQYLTAWPSGAPRPNVSTLNSYNGQVVANAAIVPSGTNNSFSMFASDATDVIVDINGYYSDLTTGGPAGPPGATGPTGATGATGAVSNVVGPSGPTGPIGPAGVSAVSAFGYAYNTAAQVVALESDITFNNSGPLLGVTVTGSSIQVASAGIYQVSFIVSGVEPSQFTMFVNGSSISGSTYGSGAGTQQNTGQVIVSLSAGDILTLRNHCSVGAVTLQTLAGGTKTNVNASVLVTRIGSFVP
jgi:hypothetical protein